MFFVLVLGGKQGGCTVKAKNVRAAASRPSFKNYLVVVVIGPVQGLINISAADDAETDKLEAACQNEDTSVRGTQKVF